MSNNHNVIVYSTPTCPYCIMAKDYLKNKGIDFKDVNVALDHSGAREMIEKSGQMGVPVVEIDDQIVLGFQPKVFEQLLK